MKIEKYLVLNKYLLTLFGVNDFVDLQVKLKDVRDEIDIDGRTNFVNVLRSSFEKLEIPEEKLLRYDENIQSYVRKINFKREPITLKYFQYLSVLFAEIVLDNLKNNKIEFLYELNEFMRNYQEDQDIKISEFTESDLKKLAFWMATGSGKTLIMHINYYQFFEYNLFSPDNIILITPGDELSKQHFEELQKSGIPSKLYGGSLSGLSVTDKEVLVIEMTKFVEEKKGGGVTLPVDVFEGRNLVFVDEGHKGKKSEEQKWAKLRNKLAETGFVFEYSATFGQILSENNKEILEEYAKSIIFDYSYKYFYLDGYGKDFSVLNVKKINIEEKEFQETMFVANLLSFYEQLLVYEESRSLAEENNLEKPLWIFVGTTVSGKEEESDVVKIIDFIRKVIQDERWLKKIVNNILDGDTKLKDEEDKDIFKDKFKYLRNKGIDFDDIYGRVFGGKGSFGVYELKNAAGEFGLKVSDNEYCGVIFIGDVSGFKKLLENKGISISQDVIVSSLFDDIKKKDSKINLLVGAKKFIEGWDTWRVSSMGLLNIGTGQGPQIIQLFGRGVRLKGKNMSLKRSRENLQVKLLENLNIYGIKADYLNKFLEAIEKEEVEFETIEIPVEFQHKDKWNTLHTLYNKQNKKYEEEEILRLEIDPKINFVIDLIPKISMNLSRDEREREVKTIQITTTSEGEKINEDIIDLFDWKRILREIYDFKIFREYWNLVFDINSLKNILFANSYVINALPETLEVKGANDIQRSEDLSLLVMKKYIDLFYRKNRKRFETENLDYDKLEGHLPFSVFEGKENQYSYTIQIDKTDKTEEKKKLIKDIKALAKNLNKLLQDDDELLPRIYFDKHLYVPILFNDKDIYKISPTGLVESERDFVTGLKKYLKKNKDRFPSFEIYLLRNFPIKGVGFQLASAGFYPDFIMWVKNKESEIIVFIDPKGLEHAHGGLDNEKIKFAGASTTQNQDFITIKDIEKKLGNKNIRIESFILSNTHYNNLIKGIAHPPSKEEYIKHHVLFLEDKDWPERLFSMIGINGS